MVNKVEHGFILNPVVIKIKNPLKYYTDVTKLTVFLTSGDCQHREPHISSEYSYGWIQRYSGFVGQYSRV